MREAGECRQVDGLCTNVQLTVKHMADKACVHAHWSIARFPDGRLLSRIRRGITMCGSAADALTVDTMTRAACKGKVIAEIGRDSQ
jgi:hypothetical protein